MQDVLAHRQSVQGQLSQRFDSDEHAISDVLSLIDEAKSTIELFDDGKEVYGSIYESECVVQRVRQKPNSSEYFAITCFVNNDEDLEFTKAFESLQGFNLFWN